MFTDGIFYNGYKELLTGDGTEVILTFLDTDILIEFAATISEYRNLSERLFILCQIAKKKKKKKKTKKQTNKQTNKHRSTRLEIFCKGVLKN